MEYYTKRQLDREARNAAKDSAKERGYRYAKVNFWAIQPSPYPNCIAMRVQVTASNPDGRFAQYETSRAL